MRLGYSHLFSLTVQAGAVLNECYDTVLVTRQELPAHPIARVSRRDISQVLRLCQTSNVAYCRQPQQCNRGQPIVSGIRSATHSGSSPGLRCAFFNSTPTPGKRQCLPQVLHMATQDSMRSNLPSDYHKKPWKYAGYRDFSSFVASDNNFFILRRFSTLSARVLLALQDELVELEDQLNVIVSHTLLSVEQSSAQTY